MCSTVFTEKAHHLDRTSMVPLMVAELNDPDIQVAMRKREELWQRAEGKGEGIERRKGSSPDG